MRVVVRLLAVFVILFSILSAEPISDSVPFANSPETNGRWLTDDGTLTENAHELLNTVRSDSSILCSKKRYELGTVERLSERAPIDPQARQLLRMKLENIALLYSFDRENGCLNPWAVYPEHIDIRKKNRSDATENVLLRNLLKGLKRYESIDANGGWRSLQGDFYLLKEGDEHRAVPEIRSRLFASGDYNGTLDGNMTFDGALAEAVKQFQERHDLKVDGIVGPKTLKALNIPVRRKIDMIKLNIERLRWLTTGEKDFIVANIPDFTLTLYREMEPELVMKTVVGSKRRPTPMLSNTVTYAVLNPYWRAPKTIVEEDILPKLRAGKFDYLEQAGIVATSASDENVTVDFRSVDWRRYRNSEELPFVFLQKPGKLNYLGFVKFMFPNDFDIYIHDTPHEELFSYRKRMKSSGCIRAEKPIELFHALFNPEDTNGWRYKKIVEEIMKKKERLVGLPHPISIYILYMTADADDHGKVRFHKDVYGYDRQMFDYLNEHEYNGE